MAIGDSGMGVIGDHMICKGVFHEGEEEQATPLYVVARSEVEDDRNESLDVLHSHGLGMERGNNGSLRLMKGEDALLRDGDCSFALASEGVGVVSNHGDGGVRIDGGRD